MKEKLAAKPNTAEIILSPGWGRGHFELSNPHHFPTCCNPGGVGRVIDRLRHIMPA